MAETLRPPFRPRTPLDHQGRFPAAVSRAVGEHALALDQLFTPERHVFDFADGIRLYLYLCETHGRPFLRVGLGVVPGSLAEEALESGECSARAFHDRAVSLAAHLCDPPTVFTFIGYAGDGTPWYGSVAPYEPPAYNFPNAN